MTRELIDEYGAWLRSWRASERTVKARTSLARGRLREWGSGPWDTETIADFLAFGKDGQRRSAWTTTTYHNNLTDFCKWMVATGRFQADPMEDVRRIKRPNKRPRPLSEPDVERVLAVVEGQVRDWITLALLAGLRSFEIAKLRGENFTPDMLFVVGKGEVEADLPLHPDLWEMAQRYPAQGYWFPGSKDGHLDPQRISATVGALFKSLGIEGSIHRCRHTYGTRLVRKGINIRVVQQLMRHASLETTAGYTAVGEDEQRAAILRLSARDVSTRPHAAPTPRRLSGVHSNESAPRPRERSRGKAPTQRRSEHP